MDDGRPNAVVVPEPFLSDVASLGFGGGGVVGGDGVAPAVAEEVRGGVVG